MLYLAVQPPKHAVRGKPWRDATNSGKLLSTLWGLGLASRDRGGLHFRDFGAAGMAHIGKVLRSPFLFLEH
jgi:hypothetical protein